MIDKDQKEELDRITRAPFSLTGIFKSWYNARWGKNADVIHLYKWAGDNNLFITRFNNITESECRVLMSPISYPAFEVEVIDYNNNEKKGFHVAMLIDMVSVTPVEVEVGLDKLVFEKAFRFDGSEVTEITS